MSTNNQQTGKIKFINPRQSYGFLTDNRNVEYFFSLSGGFDRSLQANDEVVFDITEGLRGLKAVNIRKKIKSQ